MQKGNMNQYLYGGWWSVWWMGRYSMVLSKAAFFHKKYLSLYTNEMPSSIREYTTKNRFFSFFINIVVSSLYFVYLSLCSYLQPLIKPHICAISMNTLGTVKILQCPSLWQMQLVLLLYGLKVNTT